MKHRIIGELSMLVQCNCGKTFSTESAFKRHKLIRENNFKPKWGDIPFMFDDERQNKAIDTLFHSHGVFKDKKIL